MLLKNILNPFVYHLIPVDYDFKYDWGYCDCFLGIWMGLKFPGWRIGFTTNYVSLCWDRSLRYWEWFETSKTSGGSIYKSDNSTGKWMERKWLRIFICRLFYQIVSKFLYFISWSCHSYAECLGFKRSIIESDRSFVWSLCREVMVG